MRRGRLVRPQLAWSADVVDVRAKYPRAEPLVGVGLSLVDVRTRGSASMSFASR